MEDFFKKLKTLTRNDEISFTNEIEKEQHLNYNSIYNSALNGAIIRFKEDNLSFADISIYCIKNIESVRKERYALMDIDEPTIEKDALIDLYQDIHNLSYINELKEKN
jgi:hypothetical protein